MQTASLSESNAVEIRICAVSTVPAKGTEHVNLLTIYQSSLSANGIATSPRISLDVLLVTFAFNPRTGQILLFVRHTHFSELPCPGRFGIGGCRMMIYITHLVCFSVLKCSLLCSYSWGVINCDWWVIVVAWRRVKLAGVNDQ
jgi:hypothetical protein